MQGRVLCLPNQTPNLAAQHGLARAQANEDLWVIDLDSGQKWAGADAVRRVLMELGGVWKLLAPFTTLPLARQLYGWAVRHRTWLSRWRSTTPECERPGVVCE